MKFLIILFFIFCLLKGLFYSKYELENNKNFSGAIAIGIISILGFLINTYFVLQ